MALETISFDSQRGKPNADPVGRGVYCKIPDVHFGLLLLTLIELGLFLSHANTLIHGSFEAELARRLTV